MNPQLKREVGVTKISLENGEKLLKAYGQPEAVFLEAGGDTSECRVRAVYQDGEHHVFAGFGWGYGGEGARGLRQWCEQNDVPLKMAEIVKLDVNTTGPVWVFDRLTGEIERKPAGRPRGMEF